MSKTDETISSNPYRPDVILFLIIIPFISAFNYYLTYSRIQWNGFLLLTFTLDTVQGYCAWYAVRSLIFLLDKKMPYEHGMVKRISIQIISTLFIGLFVISLLTELVSIVARGKTVPLDFYTKDLFIISIWFFAINGIYIGLHFYRKFEHLQVKAKNESRPNVEGIFAKQGKQETLLRYNQLEGFYVDEDYAVASQQGGKKYYLTQSLDKLEKSLPTQDFFRLNRQYIVHRQIVVGYKRADNGKIIVNLQNTANFPSEIPVSRLRAPSFKGWFQPD